MAILNQELAVCTLHHLLNTCIANMVRVLEEKGQLAVLDAAHGNEWMVSEFPNRVKMC